jgi:hypothetical protein
MIKKPCDTQVRLLTDNQHTYLIGKVAELVDAIRECRKAGSRRNLY